MSADNGFKTWWEKLNKHMGEDSMVAWMIYADLPMGIASQLWHDSLKCHEEKTASLREELQKALKIIDNNASSFAQVNMLTSMHLCLDFLKKGETK